VVVSGKRPNEESGFRRFRVLARQSRRVARIVAAADETRRRLERDLHDGIQQRLVSLGLKARMIQKMTPRPAEEIQRELSLLAEGLLTALDELREISHGIHPALLSEAGLGPALEALARRSAVPVELDLNLGSPLGRQAEAAGYYTASEALANAAKHAQASVIDLRAHGDDSALTLAIRDDGRGGADPSRGTGITGLKDRVEALGGTISVLSPPGHGTTLHVRLPLPPAPWPPRTAAGEKTPFTDAGRSPAAREPEGYRPAYRWLPRREGTAGDRAVRGRPGHRRPAALPGVSGLLGGLAAVA
jgi:signal transduction histidine kinase